MLNPSTHQPLSQLVSLSASWPACQPVGQPVNQQRSASRTACQPVCQCVGQSGAAQPVCPSPPHTNTDCRGKQHACVSFPVNANQSLDMLSLELINISIAEN